MFVGYQCQDFNALENSQNVRNVITVQRQMGKSQGGAGWAVAGIFNDGTSVSKYGRKELQYAIPGFFSNDDAGIIGRSLLKRLSEPRTGAIAGSIPVQSAQDFFERGVYRFILPFGLYSYEYSPVDRLDEWIKSGPGDLVPTQDIQNYVYGTSSLKLTFTNAKNDTLVVNKGVKLGKIVKINIYVQSNKKGSFLSLGFGINSINEHVLKIDIPIENQFIPIEFDLSSLDVREIGQLGFIVNENLVDEAVIQIDKIDLLLAGFKTYKLEYKKATYTLKSNKQSVKAEFGEPQARLENYIETLLTTAQELRFTQEVR